MLSIYNNNYSKTSLLLTNNFIIGFSPDEKIAIKLPVFDDLINNDSYTIALNLVFNEKNWMGNGTFIANNEYEMLWGIYSFNVFTEYKEKWENIFTNLIFKNRSFFCGERQLSKEEVDLLLVMVAVGCGIKPWQSYEDLLPKAQTEQKTLSEEEEKWRSRMKSYDEKVSKIRSNERKQKQEKTAIDQMCICIIHYFPQYTFNELKKLTYFAILELYEWSLKIQSDKVYSVAAAFGNLKDYKNLF